MQFARGLLAADEWFKQLGIPRVAFFQFLKKEYHMSTKHFFELAMMGNRFVAEYVNAFKKEQRDKRAARRSKLRNKEKPKKTKPVKKPPQDTASFEDMAMAAATPSLKKKSKQKKSGKKNKSRKKK